MTLRSCLAPLFFCLKYSCSRSLRYFHMPRSTPTVERGAAQNKHKTGKGHLWRTKGCINMTIFTNQKRTPPFIHVHVRAFGAHKQGTWGRGVHTDLSFCSLTLLGALAPPRSPSGGTWWTGSLSRDTRTDVPKWSFCPSFGNRPSSASCSRSA